MIKNYLIAKGKIKPKREMVFIPVGGAKGVKPVVSIVQGSQSDLPYTILDSDETGKQFQKSLKSGFYSSEKEKILEMDSFSGKTGSEVEDIIPLEILVDSFDRLYRSEDGIELEDLDPKAPIIPQLKAFAAENDLDLEDGWKVELSKRIKQKFKGDVPDELEQSWVELFKAINSVPEKKDATKKAA